MNGTILLVEDDDAIAAFIIAGLQREGYKLSRVCTGTEALNSLQRHTPDLVLLDLMLPGEVDGLQVCRALRQREAYVPIIMVTAKENEVDKIVGLELGADDYMTKPFSLRELQARVQAVLRLARSHTKPQDERLCVGALELDRARREVWVNGRSISLTPKEFDLLALLVSQRGRVFGREMLLQQVWGYDYLGDSRTVDMHIQRLRHKLEPDPAHPSQILTVHGIGYKFALKEK